MKKKLAMASAVATAFAFGVGVIVPYVIDNNHASAETNYGECYYVNNNQVSMTKNEYDLLHSIGFDDYEIENMTESKFDKLMAMGFLSNQNGVSLQSHITPSTTVRRFEDNDDTKIMDTYVSFTKVKSGYKVFVKQNVLGYRAQRAND